MTAEEARARYSKNSENGYVDCSNCPIFADNGGDEAYCPPFCTGYDDTHKAIADYIIEKEAKEKTPSPTNNVDHPSHYTHGGIECIDAMLSAFGKEAVANFCMCNCFKYLWRHKYKNGIEDLQKADWYLKKYEELMGGASNVSK